MEVGGGTHEPRATVMGLMRNAGRGWRRGMGDGRTDGRGVVPTATHPSGDGGVGAGGAGGGERRCSPWLSWPVSPGCSGVVAPRLSVHPLSPTPAPVFGCCP